MELHKDILRDLFRRAPVANDTKRNRVHGLPVHLNRSSKLIRVHSHAFTRLYAGERAPGCKMLVESNESACNRRADAFSGVQSGMHRLSATLLLLISFTFVLTPHAQDPSPSALQPTHPTSTPYTGDLGIFEEPNRDKLLQTDRVLDTLRLHTGSSLADIGAGGGWFSVRAARRVGPSGHVYAEDINEHAIDTIHARAEKEHLPQITTVLGTPNDPRLAPDSIDAAVMLRVYHEVAHPALVLEALHTALKSGGRFGVIDHPGHGDDHGINADVVRAETERNGFRFVGLYDFTKGDQNDYMEVFEKR